MSQSFESTLQLSNFKLLSYVSANLTFFFTLKRIEISQSFELKFFRPPKINLFVFYDEQPTSTSTSTRKSNKSSMDRRTVRVFA